MYLAGFLPGLLWILIGVTLGGAVHDFVILTASVRRGGMSLAELARNEIGPRAGALATIAIFFTVTIAISAMGFAVVKILEGSPWATFTESIRSRNSAADRCGSHVMWRIAAPSRNCCKNAWLHSVRWTSSSTPLESPSGPRLWTMPKKIGTASWTRT